jgi:spermidine/putrescine transport system substrate-binding protein
MKRRSFGLAAVGIVAGAWSRHAHAQPRQLFLYNWSNYMPPDLLKRFTAETGIAVTLDTYDSNQTMLAKIQVGGGGYDIVVPTGPTVQTMIRNNLLLKIDAGKLENFKNVGKSFDHPDFDPERAYSVPYMWGTTAIAYDSAVLPPGTQLESSWKELFQPRPEFVGKIGMLKDIGEVISATAFYLGDDACTADPTQAQRILDLLEKQKPAVKLYNSEGTVDRLSNREVAMQLMWNGSFHRAHKKRASLVYMFPKEGFNLWGDNLAIPRGAKNIDDAKLFLNWMMDPKNAAEASDFTGYNNAISGSDVFLTADLKLDPAINISPEVAALLQPTRECPKAALDMREKIWTRLLR